MPVSEIYQSQVQLLIRCLPAVEQVPFFALRGGTAINLFCRNMPRVSVDIDLAYLPVNDRETALCEIRTGIIAVSKRLRQLISHRAQIQMPSDALRLFISLENVRIKLEVNDIVRGMFAAACEESNLQKSAPAARSICGSAKVG